MNNTNKNAFFMPVNFSYPITFLPCKSLEKTRNFYTEILKLPEAYPQFISADKLKDLMFAIQQEALNYGQELLSFSASSVVGIISALVYLILVPVLIFFCLKA